MSIRSDRLPSNSDKMFVHWPCDHVVPIPSDVGKSILRGVMYTVCAVYAYHLVSHSFSSMFCLAEKFLQACHCGRGVLAT